MYSSTIEYDEGIEQTTCNCKMMTIKEIPCRHFICYLTYMGIIDLPQYLINDRWLQSRSRSRDYGIEQEKSNNKSKLFNLYKRYYDIAKKEANHKRVKEYLHTGTENLEKKLGCNKGKEVKGLISRFEKKNKSNVVVRNPRVIKTKGGGKGGRRGKGDPRFRSIREMMALKSRARGRCNRMRHIIKSCTVDV